LVNGVERRVLNEARVGVEVTSANTRNVMTKGQEICRLAGNDVREIPQTLDNSPENIWNWQMPNNFWCTD